MGPCCQYGSRTFGWQSRMGPVQLASGPMGALNGPSIPQNGYYWIVFSGPNTIDRVTLPMALNGLSISHSRYYQWPQMGPVLHVERLADDLQWAQKYSQWLYPWFPMGPARILPIVLNRPRITLKGYYVGLEWAQYSSKWIPLMVSNGPSKKITNGLERVQHFSQCTTNGLKWAQYCMWNIWPTISNGPSKDITDSLEWAWHSHNG